MGWVWKGDTWYVYCPRLLGCPRFFLGQRSIIEWRTFFFLCREDLYSDVLHGPKHAVPLRSPHLPRKETSASSRTRRRTYPKDVSNYRREAPGRSRAVGCAPRFRPRCTPRGIVTQLPDHQQRLLAPLPFYSSTSEPIGMRSTLSTSDRRLRS